MTAQHVPTLSNTQKSERTQFLDSVFEFSRKPSMDFGATNININNDIKIEHQNAQKVVSDQQQQHNDFALFDFDFDSNQNNNSSSLFQDSNNDQKDIMRSDSSEEHLQPCFFRSELSGINPFDEKQSVPQIFHQQSSKRFDENFMFTQQQQQQHQKMDIQIEEEQFQQKKQEIQQEQKIVYAHKPFLIKKKKIQKVKKNYDKNICRYLSRKTIRCFAKFEYQEQVLQFCEGDQELYSESTEYFVRRIEQISGFRVLKEYLDISQEEDPKIQKCKLVFKRFYKWFLKERIARYIMNGEMEDKQMYIKYKNEVMLQYVDTLADWKSNKNLKKILKTQIC